MYFTKKYQTPTSGDKRLLSCCSCRWTASESRGQQAYTLAWLSVTHSALSSTAGVTPPATQNQHKAFVGAELGKRMATESTRPTQFLLTGFMRFYIKGVSTSLLDFRARILGIFALSIFTTIPPLSTLRATRKNNLTWDTSVIITQCTYNSMTQRPTAIPIVLLLGNPVSNELLLLCTPPPEQDLDGKQCAKLTQHYAQDSAIAQCVKPLPAMQQHMWALV